MINWKDLKIGTEDGTQRLSINEIFLMGPEHYYSVITGIHVLNQFSVGFQTFEVTTPDGLPANPMNVDFSGMSHIMQRMLHDSATKTGFFDPENPIRVEEIQL